MQRTPAPHIYLSLVGVPADGHPPQANAGELLLVPQITLALIVFDVHGLVTA